jgi:hypothetical protein
MPRIAHDTIRLSGMRTISKWKVSGCTKGPIWNNIAAITLLVVLATMRPPASSALNRTIASPVRAA